MEELVRVRPEPTPQAWSPENLAQKREEFWHTRVENRREIWDAIKSAAEVMEKDADGRGAFDAAAILKANSITSETGDLTTCYDAMGARYIVPNFCLAKPSNMLVGLTAVVDANRRACSDVWLDMTMWPRRSCTAINTATSHIQTSNVRQSGDDDEKRLPENTAFGSSLNLCVRVGANDVGVSCGKHDYVASLKQKVVEHLGEKDASKLRLFFYGKELQDAFFLSRCSGISYQIDNNVEICLVGVLNP